MRAFVEVTTSKAELDQSLSLRTEMAFDKVKGRFDSKITMLELSCEETVIASGSIDVAEFISDQSKNL